MTTMLETQDAPPAGGEDLIEEVALPAGTSLEDLLGDEDEDASSAPPAEKAGDEEPTAPAAPSPVAAPAEKKDEPKKGDVRVALKKTREELKDTKSRLKKATSPNAWERIEAQRAEARLKQSPGGRQRAAAPEMKNADMQAARAEAVTASEKAGSFDTADGAVVEVALSHATKMFQTWQKDPDEASDFWEGVKFVDDDNSPVEQRLRIWLEKHKFGAGASGKGVEKADDREGVFHCVCAWNAWRDQGDGVEEGATHKYPKKYTDSAGIPEAI